MKIIGRILMHLYGMNKKNMGWIMLIISLFTLADKSAANTDLLNQKQNQAKKNWVIIAPTVMVKQGKLIGINESGVDEFLGVRYAFPPIGAMRWRPPHPVLPSIKQVKVTQFGSNCPQTVNVFGSSSLSEDCLFLNIYTPSNASNDASSKSLPVMVWIHGGGLRSGSGASYNPTDMVKQGKIIVITINYRLGILGFLAHPAFNHEGHDIANYGIMDQQLALQWVKDNIAAFGGNPKNITIFGESGGGTAIYANLASPLAAKLFQKAIIQSGFLSDISLKTAEELGIAFAKQVGCNKGSSSETASCLRGLPTTTILSSQKKQLVHGVVIIDGKTLPKSLMSAFGQGKFNQVPIINGTTHDEGNLLTAVLFDLAGKKIKTNNYQTALVTIANWQAEVIPGFAYKPSVVEAIMKEYPLNNYHSPGLAASAVITDSTLACPSYEANLLLAHWTPTWVYEFSDKAAPEIVAAPISYPYGASHFSEMAYLFDMSSLTRPGSTSLSITQRYLSRQMIQYWTSFARNGDPNSLSSVVRWPAFKNSKSSSILQLNQPDSVVEKNFRGL